jgi:hypothetical protein
MVRQVSTMRRTHDKFTVTTVVAAAVGLAVERRPYREGVESLDGTRRERRIALPAGEAFISGRRDELPVGDDRGRGVVEVRRYTENVPGEDSPLA